MQQSSLLKNDDLQAASVAAAANKFALALLYSLFALICFFLFILNRLSFVLNLFSEENCKSDLDPLRVVGVGLLPYHCLRVSAKLLNENIQKAAVMSIFKVKK